MPRLKVESGPHKGDSAEVRKSQPFLVGSGSGCDLQLSGEGIAGQHLVIKALKDGGFGVKQLAGSFQLNGRAAQAARLSEGDVIEVGSHRLRFAPAAAAARPAKDLGGIGGFRLEELIGKGGMGTVYRAEQVSLHRKVALKILNEELTKDDVFIKRFVAEARSAARLQHKNVVHVFDVGKEGHSYYLSMELMAGGSLEERMREADKISVDEAVQMIADAAEGLAYAERLGIVHRDIKPDNLMLDQHGHVKIADLGLATTDIGASEKIVGTPHFMSPEQVQRKPVDHRSDLYSLGCTFYRLLTGHTPFKGTSVKEILRSHLKDEPTPPDHANPAVPHAVSAVVLKLMAKEPADRYQSATELLEDLQAIQTPPVANKKGLLITLAGIAAIGIGAVIWMALQDKDPEKVIQKVTEKDPKMAAKLRETEAKARFLEIKSSNFGPLEMARAFEAMARDEKYRNTVAAQDASKEADRIRKAEASKTAAQKALEERTTAAIAALDNKVQPLIDAGKLREAALLAAKPGVPTELARRPRVQQRIKDLRTDLQNLAKKQLDAWKGTVDQAFLKKEIAAMRDTIPKLEAVFDKTKGWPRLLLADAAGLREFIREAKKNATTLEVQLAGAAEKKSWLEYRTAGLTVLQTAATLDFEAAHKLAAAIPDRLGKTRAADFAKHLSAVVQAAHDYQKAYVEKLGAGAVSVTLSGVANGGITGTVRILRAQLTGNKAGFVLEDASGQSHQLGLAGLGRTMLDQLFVPIQKGDVELKHQRLAFLILPVLHGHMEAASRYLSTLDPTKDDSGTGKAGFTTNTIRLRELLRQVGDRPKEAWAAYLRDETRAIATLLEGLRALSDRRNRAAEQAFERLLKNNSRTFVAWRFGQ